MMKEDTRMIYGIPRYCYDAFPVEGFTVSLNIIYAIYNVIYAIAVSYSFTYILFIINHCRGLPPKSNAFILLSLAYCLFLIYCGTLNPSSLRSGVPFFTIFNGCFVWGCALLATMILHVIEELRKIIRQIAGHAHLTSTEKKFYQTLSSIFYIWGFIAFIISFLADTSMLPGIWTNKIQHGNYYFIGVVCCNIFTISYIIMYIRIRNHDRTATRLILRYKLIWITGVAGSLIGMHRLINWNFAPYPDQVMCNNDYFLQTQKHISIKLMSHIVQIGLYLVLLPALMYLIRSIIKDLKQKRLVPLISQKIFYRSMTIILLCIFTWTGSLLIFSITILISFLKSIFIIILIGGTYWFWVSHSLKDNFLIDFTVAGLLRYNEQRLFHGSFKTNLYFFTPWIVQVGAQAALLVGVVTSRIIPWTPISKLALLDIYRYISFEQATEILRIIFGLTMVTYMLEMIFSFIAACIPKIRYMDYRDIIIARLIRGRQILRFFIYYLGPLPGIRLLLSVTECDDMGNLNIKTEIPCDGKGWHLLLINLCYNVSTWCIGLGCLYHSAHSLLRTEPNLCQRPKVDLANALLQCSMVLLMHLVQGQLMVIIAFALVFFFWILDLRFPAVVGYPQLNWIRFSISTCVLHVYITALSNFDYPHAVGPFIALIVPLPIIAYGSYRFGKWYINLSALDETVKELLSDLIKIMNEMHRDTVTLSNLSSRELGILLHTKTFQKYLCDHLIQERNDNISKRIRYSITQIDSDVNELGVGVSKKSFSNIIPISSHDINKNEIGLHDINKNDIIYVLAALDRALEMECGIYALSHASTLVALLPYFLKEQVPLECQKYTIKNCLKIQNHLGGEIKKYCTGPIIRLWAQTYDNEIQRGCADLIHTIIGNDRIILYPTGDSNGPTVLHRQLYAQDKDGIMKLQIVGRCIWIIPIDDYKLQKRTSENQWHKSTDHNNANDNEKEQKMKTSTHNENSTSSYDCVDGLLSFPPLSHFSVNLINTLPLRARLYIRTDDTFDSFEELEGQKRNSNSNIFDISHIDRWLLGTLDIPQLGENTDIQFLRDSLTQYYKGMLKQWSTE